MPSFEEIVESVNERPIHIRIIILLLIITVLSGAFWYFYWDPKSQELNKLETNLQKRTKLKNEYENIARELPKFEAEFDRLSKEFQEASKKLPVTKEIPALIDSIYSSINASGLKPISFVPRKEVQKDVYIEIPISLDVRGSYFELANFFDRLSKLPRIVNIRNLNLKRGKSSGKIIELNAQFSAITFRVKPIPEGGAKSKTQTKSDKNRRKRR
jgi:type IV pilus assembly protein PilO